jgi:hypothetical protein
MSLKMISGMGIWASMSLGTVVYTACYTKRWSQCWRTMFDQAVAIGLATALL